MMNHFYKALTPKTGDVWKWKENGECRYLEVITDKFDCEDRIGKLLPSNGPLYVLWRDPTLKGSRSFSGSLTSLRSNYYPLHSPEEYKFYKTMVEACILINGDNLEGVLNLLVELEV